MRAVFTDGFGPISRAHFAIVPSVGLCKRVIVIYLLIAVTDCDAILSDESPLLGVPTVEINSS